MEGMNKRLKKAASALLAIVFSAICILDLNVKLMAYSDGGAEKPLTETANEMAIKINEARAELGLKPLLVVNYLTDIANTRARELIDCYESVDDEGRHLRPSGETWDTIIDTSLVPFEWADENIARGSANVDRVFEAWKKSEYHWNAITNPNATHMGIGLCFEENASKKWFWSTIYIDLFDGNTLEGEYIPEKYPIKPACSGDLTGDGIIDSYDLVLIYQYLDDEMYFNDLQKESADLLKDGNITSADAAVLRKYLLGDYKTLPVTIDMLMGG
ncbi:MAG TPA: CAP domain-containing protein [Ruminococcus sp.]|nr:CAP domain-containing protein [Ruminococcus sp.]